MENKLSEIKQNLVKSKPKSLITDIQKQTIKKPLKPEIKPRPIIHPLPKKDLIQDILKKNDNYRVLQRVTVHKDQKSLNDI